MPMADTAAQAQTPIRLVLFDLDGTFADTAPDLAYALNETLKRNGRAPLGYERIRSQVSHGGVALIRLGFQIEPDNPDFEAYRGQLLEQCPAERFFSAPATEEAKAFLEGGIVE